MISCGMCTILCAMCYVFCDVRGVCVCVCDVLGVCWIQGPNKYSIGSIEFFLNAPYYVA